MKQATTVSNTLCGKVIFRGRASYRVARHKCDSVLQALARPLTPQPLSPSTGGEGEQIRFAHRVLSRRPTAPNKLAVGSCSWQLADWQLAVGSWQLAVAVGSWQLACEQ